MLKSTLDDNMKLVKETIAKNNLRKDKVVSREVHKDLDNARKTISEKEKRLMVELTTKDAKN